jgi:hypothetical protein
MAYLLPTYKLLHQCKQRDKKHRMPTHCQVEKMVAIMLPAP